MAEPFARGKIGRRSPSVRPAVEEPYAQGRSLLDSLGLSGGSAPAVSLSLCLMDNSLTPLSLTRRGTPAPVWPRRDWRVPTAPDHRFGINDR
jgi:hypothetical protein